MSHWRYFISILIIFDIYSGYSNSFEFSKKLNTNLRLKTIIPSLLVSSGLTLLTVNDYSGANAIQQVEYAPNDIQRLKRGYQEIDFLLSNWDEKTTYCNFGVFQNELLKPENKQKLMIAAKETGLLDYDKSATMNILCKRDPDVVRAFLGTTKDNLVLSKAEALMKKTAIVDTVDPDKLDEYFEAVDRFTESVGAAEALAYQARTDFASQENATKESLMAKTSSNGIEQCDYLCQSKTQVLIVRDSLKIIIDDLKL